MNQPHLVIVPDLHALFDSVLVTPFVGAAIVFFRLLRKMTQEELAEAADVDLSALKRLEKGRKTGGWTRTLEQVTRALNIKQEDLFDKARWLACQAALTAILSGQK